MAMMMLRERDSILSKVRKIISIRNFKGWKMNFPGHGVDRKSVDIGLNYLHMKFGPNRWSRF